MSSEQERPRVKRMSGPRPAPDGEPPDRAWVSVSRKVQLGKFDMLEVSVGASVNVGEGESMKDALRRAWKDVRQEHGDMMEVAREDNEV